MCGAVTNGGWGMERMEVLMIVEKVPLRGRRYVILLLRGIGDKVGDSEELVVFVFETRGSGQSAR
jgi:hypothetical protein